MSLRHDFCHLVSYMNIPGYHLHSNVSVFLNNIAKRSMYNVHPAQNFEISVLFLKAFQTVYLFCKLITHSGKNSVMDCTCLFYCIF